MYRITVTELGQSHDIVWDEGKIRTDVAILSYLEAMIPIMRVFSPGASWYGEQIRQEGGAFYLMCKQLFDRVEVTEGELPDLGEPVPEGAIV